MKNLIISFAVLLLLFSTTYSQRTQKSVGRILINPRKPAVFLSYLEKKEMKTSDQPKGDDYLFFKITNNTRWQIWLDMSGAGGKEFGQASLYYAIEDPKTDQNISGAVRCHVCSVNPLGSGRSIIFSFPASEAATGLRMRIVYRFDWEDDLLKANVHSVEYYFRDLPRNTLTP